MRVRVLGPLELIDGSPPGSGVVPPNSVTLRSIKLRRLLAVLVVHAGAVVSVDRLADIVWGDAPPENVDAALQSLVSRLRNKLRGEPHGPVDAAGPPEITLLTRAPGYLVRIDRDALDANHFEDLVGQARALLADHPAQAARALDEALALWRGPAFAEFADDDFARPAAARLEELRTAACEHRIEAALRLGLPEEALVLLEPLLAGHPLRERPRAQLMLALYRLERQVDALEAYRTYRQRLGEELGLDPSASLHRLEGRILRQDPDLEWSVPQRIEIDGPVDSSPPPASAPAFPATPLPPGAAEDSHARRGNLPVTLPTLLGRDGELTRVCALVRSGQVVTLTGPGGVGKTSLAQHAAARVSHGFPEGAWFCELAPISDPGTVPEAVTTLLAVPPREGLSPTDRLVAYLRSQHALLVLDNCEHVAVGAAYLVQAVLRDCPDVAVLATSREPLRVDGERVRPVTPLEVPPTGAVSVAGSPAVRLFAARATAAEPDFTLTEANAAAVAEVCRRLDGLPLAIELAAARMRSMSAADLAGRLSWRFRLLRGGLRTAADRHRTLRAVVDWSYELLSEEQRQVFDRLSVFAGSFPLEAAEAVAASDSLEFRDIADVLAALVDRSMVVAQTAGSAGRYVLLETLRAYGHEQLESRGEAQAVHRAHAEYVAAFTEGAAERMYGSEHGHWTDAISRQFDDLRAAHEWALRYDLELAARLVVALGVYVEERMSAEAGRWAERTLEAAGAVGWASAGLAQVHAVAASAAIIAGDLERAAQRVEDGHAFARTGSLAQGHLRYVQAQLAGFEGRLREADELCVETIRAISAGPLRWFADQAAAARVMYAAYSGDIGTAAALGERLCARTDREADPTAMAWARYALAEALLDAEPERARELLDQVLRLAYQVGERYLTGVALVSVASSLARHGDPWRALPLYRDVIEHWRLAGSWMHQWTTMRNVVDLLVRLGWDEPASVLYGAVVSRTTAAPVFGDDAERLAEAHRVLNDRIDPEKFAAVTSRGATMTDDQTVAFAREVLAQMAEDRAGQRS